MILSLLPSPPADHLTRGRPAAHAWVGLIGLALVTSAVVVAIAGPTQVRAVVADAKPAPLAAALIAQAAALLCVTGLYRATHQTVGGQSRARGSGRVGLAALGLTQALPGGGAAGALMAACRFRQLGSSPVAAANAVVHLGFISLAGLVSTVTIAATWAAVTSGQHAGAALAGVALFGSLVITIVVLRRTGLDLRLQSRVLARLAEQRRPAAFPRPAWVREAHEPAPLCSPRELRLPYGWALAKWSLDLVVLALVVVAVDGRLPLGAIALAYAAVNLLNSIPLTPGGVGLVEGGMTASLHAAGLDPGTAAAIALSYRLVSYWLPLTLTVPITLSELAAATRQPAVGAPQVETA